MLEKLFKLSENKTDVKTEVLAGVTTFMTMAYILAVNPSILSAAGMDSGAVFTATALAAFVGTLLMAVLANYPFALAPGMGLNAYFAYTVVLGMGYKWEVALTAVFVEGIVFIVLSLTNIREAIFNAIPKNLKSAVSVGIGLFIFLWAITGEFGLGCIGLLVMFTGFGQVVIYYTQQSKNGEPFIQVKNDKENEEQSVKIGGIEISNRRKNEEK